jgi:putative DNA primase/helicase
VVRVTDEPQRPDDDAEVARLAALPPLAYEREREAAAKLLGVRVSILDQSVEAKRAELDGRSAQAPSLMLANPEPWPEPIDGTKLLADIAKAVRSYVVVEDGAAEAVALWTLHAHALDAFAYSPRLAITSAEKRCGKTTLLDLLGCLVPRPLPTANATAPAIFRTIELSKPTLLIDEADNFLKAGSELHGVLNSGHRRGGSVLRLVGDEHEPRDFNTFAATAIAMIGRLPDTLADRSIEIRLRRRLPNETVQRFRADRATGQLARMAARWAGDHMEALRRADPPAPKGLHDRAANNWEPLFTIADETGGEWPERARNIAVAFSARNEDGGSIGELLLGDIRQVFDQLASGAIKIESPKRIADVDRIRSVDLARLLAEIEGRPWADWGVKRQPLTPNALARHLKPFQISPTTHRFRTIKPGGVIESEPDKGYERRQFEDAFGRYVPSIDASELP